MIPAEEASKAAYGVERRVGELSRDLTDGTHEPSPVRQMLIPKKKQPAKFRPLGATCLRDRVAQTSAMLVPCAGQRSGQVGLSPAGARV